VPVIVLVGIYGGVVTVTEAAAIAAVVSLLVSLIYYRGFHWSETLWVVADALKSASAIMLIVATALAFGHWMTASGIPAQLVKWVLAQNMAPWQFLLVINVLLLVLGCFLEVDSRRCFWCCRFSHRCLPALGVDPVHFSIIFTHNMEIALVHPPVGLNLFVLSTISHAPIGEVVRGVLPFLILLLIVLMIHHLRAGAHDVAAARGLWELRGRDVSRARLYGFLAGHLTYRLFRVTPKATLDSRLPEWAMLIVIVEYVSLAGRSDRARRSRPADIGHAALSCPSRSCRQRQLLPDRAAGGQNCSRALLNRGGRIRLRPFAPLVSRGRSYDFVVKGRRSPCRDAAPFCR